MTKEEIEELKGLAASMGLYDDKNPCKRAVILGKAIQALEQEPVLDKIRAEIEQKCCITVRSENEPAITLYDVFQILDKYRGAEE